MSRIQFLLVAVVLALAYTAANVVDAALADFDLLTRLIDTLATVLSIPVMIAFWLLLLGGLPLAALGLLLERQWTRVPVERRVTVRVPYAVLMFQIVSMVFSGLVLALMVPEMLWPLSLSYVAWLCLVYFVVQVLASISVIPVWRRLLSPMGSVLRLSGGPAVSA